MAPISTLSIERPSPGICKISFANPPVNLIIPETVVRLSEIVNELSEDKAVKVVIFSSRQPDYFYNHFDLLSAAAFAQGADTDVPAWTDLVIRLSKAPFITIASIRGRARGGGNELALDLRYASREKAFFGQAEVGSGLIPGGGGSERLPRLIGRDRALEAILTSNDYDAATAERYGWVTRTLADSELDTFVDKLAARLASFDKSALLAAKNQINRATLPPDQDLVLSYREFLTTLNSPGFKERAGMLGKLFADFGLEDVEKRLGYYLGLGTEQNEQATT